MDYYDAHKPENTDDGGDEMKEWIENQIAESVGDDVNESRSSYLLLAVHVCSLLCLRSADGCAVVVA